MNNPKQALPMHDVKHFGLQYEVFNPEMMKLAREARGLTQKELCEKMNIRQGTVSKIENFLLPFTDELAALAAKALNYPKNFFTQKSHQYALSPTYYRRVLSLPGKTLQQVEAKLNVARMCIEQLLKSVDYPDSNIFSWDVEKDGEPERAAQLLRERWRVPKGPIRKLIELLEDNGVIVVSFDFGADGIDGFAMRASNNVPLIFFNCHLQGDRRRLTIAHELGHLIMHILHVLPDSRDLEDEAFRFATEFLVPENELFKGFSKLDLPTLANMKRYWLVSMRSLIYKAERRKKITTNQSRYLWQQMARNNYIKREPEALDVPKEEPLLLREIIEVYENDLDYSLGEIAQTVFLSEEEFKATYLVRPEDRPRFTIIRNIN